jgi:hypothetical protein
MSIADEFRQWRWPCMPIGRPGREVEGTRRDAFDAVLFGNGRRRSIYRHYDARKWQGL